MNFEKLKFPSLKFIEDTSFGKGVDCCQLSLSRISYSISGGGTCLKIYFKKHLLQCRNNVPAKIFKKHPLKTNA